MRMKKLFFTVLFFGVLFLAKAQEHFVVYFDNNKFELNKTEQAKFDKWISENKTSKILSITGSTDEVGSSGFNDTLSLKRVNFVYSKVNGKLKIREDFKSISLGEKGATSPNKAENRKAIIHYLLEKDLAKENEILGIKPTVIEPEEIIPIEEENMNFPENATLEEKIKLSKKGTLIRLSDINFYVNTFAIMPNSKRSIDELIYVMDHNPKLRIEIQGHICCVPKDARNLSLDRARQVKRLLVYSGISERRIDVKGFGVSKPKFPIPEKNESEAAKNRRVEIMILDK
jgi:outer membrane protein OmpA-like peptidoglycan-associated protein